MNKALKAGGVRILNLSRTILQCLCCPDFYFKCFFKPEQQSWASRLFLLNQSQTLAHALASTVDNERKKRNAQLFIM